ncbi:hypothetical protein GmHk_11G032759 [Glycine max]|nr:hypothetical protein GmHk_11G032759 [Glycine max]
MFDEELQPPPQSYEFMSQQNHHQEYGHNSQFFSASREHFMSNLIDTNLQTSESTYAYMQSDDCVEYHYMEFKCNDDVGKITKGPIKLSATFGHSTNEMLALLHKPRKPRTTYEIIDLLRDEYV